VYYYRYCCAQGEPEEERGGGVGVVDDARDMRTRKEEPSERVFWSGRKRSSAAATKLRSLTSPTVAYAPRTTVQQTVMAFGR